MNFFVSADRRAFQPPGCGRPNIDVAALRNVGLSCPGAIDIIAAIAVCASVIDGSAR
jgi:hypothetical protein